MSTELQQNAPNGLSPAQHRALELMAGGLGGQARPRSDSNSQPLVYPFTSEFGFVFGKQKSGNRTFDLNKDGVAHYGMVADHIQDIRERSSNRVYEAVMSSAEAYIQMWERAYSNISSTYAVH